MEASIGGDIAPLPPRVVASLPGGASQTPLPPPLLRAHPVASAQSWRARCWALPRRRMRHRHPLWGPRQHQPHKAQDSEDSRGTPCIAMTPPPHTHTQADTTGGPQCLASCRCARPSLAGLQPRGSNKKMTCIPPPNNTCAARPCLSLVPHGLEAVAAGGTGAACRVPSRLDQNGGTGHGGEPGTANGTP
jgi:hypothetical protein